jgi:hypothetical protein
MAKIGFGLGFVFCLCVMVGCDYGVPQGETIHGEEERCLAYAELEAALANGDTDWFDIKKMGVIGRIPSFALVAPADFILEEFKEENDYSNCNCSEVCTICADAYICGHEATAAQACQQCAKCQQSCGDMDAVE